MKSIISLYVEDELISPTEPDMVSSLLLSESSNVFVLSRVVLIFTDISKTSGDPLAKVMRRELRKRGINHLAVVTSTELPIKPISFEEGDERTPASSPFVPPSAGLLIASIVCKNIMNA